jgi:glucosamine-6-phosphate deaminase
MNRNLEIILSKTREELGAGSPIKLKIVESDKDMCYDMALEILDEIRANNETGRKSVFIWPVGPVGQYPVLITLIHRYKVSLRNVHVFQMDEYLDDNLAPIPLTNALSFTAHLKRFAAQIDPALRIPENQIYTPTPGREHCIWQRIQELGGVDTAFGGIGINGHIAFNEPPEMNEAITDEEFKNLPTRVLKITRETRTINSNTGTRGAIDLIPEHCVTIGMKEILSAKRIRFYMNRDWQSGIVRKILHGEVTRFVPGSFFQKHPDAALTITEAVAQPPMGALR